MLYFYESHVAGGVYMTKKPIDEEDLYCDLCGDHDHFLGAFESWAEFIKGVDSSYWHFLDLDDTVYESGYTEEQLAKLNPQLTAYLTEKEKWNR